MGQRTHLKVAGIVAGAAFAGAYLASLVASWPDIPLSGTVRSLGTVSWYLMPLGLALGLAGMLYFIASRRQASSVFVWLMTAGNMLPLLLLGTLTAPDHFWAIRRFMPIVLPALLMFAAGLLWRFIPRRRGDWLLGLLPLAVSALMLLGFLDASRPVADVVEYDGLIDQLEDLAGAIPDDAIVLIEDSGVATRISLPLWLVHDKAVFTMSEAAIDDEAFRSALNVWREADRPVYWLDADGDLSNDWRGLNPDYKSTWSLSFPLVERAFDGLPDESGLFTGALDLYAFGDQDVENRRFAVTIQANDGTEDEAIDGMHAPDWISGMPPSRWTTDLVTLRFPAIAQPESLSLMMAGERPAGLAPPLIRISSAGKELGRIQLDAGARSYTIPAAESAEPLSGGYSFQLEIDTWQPDQVLGNGDGRDLGIRLYWAKLIFKE